MARKSRKDIPPPAPAAPEPFWRAALYIRLSAELDSGRGDSLKTQRQIMEAHIALYPDIESVGVYTDNGVSGRTFEREGFQRMLHDIETGGINCVVVKDLSRLGRNAIDTGFYVEKYFPTRHIRLIAVNDQYDSEEDDNSGSHIIVPLKNLMNEAYAADIGKKVRSQKRIAMLDGAFVGSFAPYGYRKDPDNRRHLLVDENTAPIVQRIFQWIADGIPVNETVRRLNEAGVLTPGCYLASAGMISSKRLAGGGTWQTRIVGRILQNEVYTGDLVQGKSSCVGHKQVPVGSEDWIVTRNAHEPIISREMFAKAQAIRTEAAGKYAALNKTPYSKNILQGKVFCGHCGRIFQRQRHSGRYYYGCLSNNQVGKGFCNKGVRCLSEDNLLSAVLTVLQKEAKIVIGNSQRLKLRGGWAASQKAEAECEIAELSSEIKRKRADRRNLYQSFVSGLIGEREYMASKERYNQEIHQAAERVRVLRERQCLLEHQIEEYFALVDQLAAVKRRTKLTADLVERMIERVTVNSPEDISVQFRFSDVINGLMEVPGDE